MPGKSQTEANAVGIDKNTVDNDFLLAVSSGIICHHLGDLVTACKNAEDINDHKGLRFVISLLT